MKQYMKLGILTVTALLCIIVCVPSKTVNASTYKGFSYSEKGNGTICIDAYLGKKKSVVTPKKIKSKKVTEISGSAFAGNYRITKLVISEGIELIGDMALYDMQKLKSVSLPMTLKSISEKCGMNYYSEASGFPKKSYTVVKGSPAFRFVVKKYSSSKIHVKKTNKVVLWFSANGGTKAPAAKVVKKGKKYKKLSSPKRSDYKFLGWYTKKKGGKRVTEKTKAVKNKTVYAHWELTNLVTTLSRPEISDSSVQFDCIYFGNYAQSDPAGQRKDRIKWRVLRKSGHKVLLLADTVLDIQPFLEKASQTEGEITWEKSTLRSWLNGYSGSDNLAGIDYTTSNFCDSAFNTKEKGAIENRELENYRYTWGNYQYSGGGSYHFGVGYTVTEERKSTSDKIFLLDIEDLRKESYGLSENETRLCSLSDYAKAKLSFSDATPRMLLRSVYEEKKPLSVSMGDGRIGNMLTYEENACVRPAIYVNLSDNGLWSKAGTVKIAL